MECYSQEKYYWVGNGESFLSRPGFSHFRKWYTTLEGPGYRIVLQYLGCSGLTAEKSKDRELLERDDDLSGEILALPELRDRLGLTGGERLGEHVLRLDHDARSPAPLRERHPYP